MRTLLKTCKEKGRENPVFVKAIDNVLKKGEKLNKNSRQWLSLLKNEIVHLQNQKAHMSKQLKMAQNAQDEKMIDRITERIRVNTEASINLVSIVKQLVEGEEKTP